MRALRAIPILLETHHGVGEHRGHGLVVRRSARVEESIFFDQLERIALPVLAIGLDHVDVREQQQGLEACVAARQHRDEVAVLRAIGRHDDVQLLVGITRGAQARLHRVRGIGA